MSAVHCEFRVTIPTSKIWCKVANWLCDLMMVLSVKYSALIQFYIVKENCVCYSGARASVLYSVWWARAVYLEITIEIGKQNTLTLPNIQKQIILNYV